MPMSRYTTLQNERNIVRTIKKFYGRTENLKNCFACWNVI